MTDAMATAVNDDPEVALAPRLHDTERGWGTAILSGIQGFLAGTRPYEEHRTLATLLFVDIVGATEKAVQSGDAAWRELLLEFQRRAARTLEHHSGRLVDTAGDGIFASFDAPSRAVRCALALCAQSRALGLQTRAGVHIGEVERLGRKFGGVAVHIGARIMRLAAAGDVLVSSTVKDIVTGSGLRFDDCGTHALKGVPDQWRLFHARERRGQVRQ
jgi:class 3 adenylate cyclase